MNRQDIWMLNNEFGCGLEKAISVLKSYDFQDARDVLRDEGFESKWDRPQTEETAA